MSSQTEINRNVAFKQRLLRLAGYFRHAITGAYTTHMKECERKWKEDEDVGKAKFGEYDVVSEANISTLIPEAQSAARKFMRLAKADAEEQGFEIIVSHGTDVFKKRKSHSDHEFGVAFDVYISKGGKPAEDESYERMGKLAKKVGLIWGGSEKDGEGVNHFRLKGKEFESKNLQKVF